MLIALAVVASVISNPLNDDGTIRFNVGPHPEPITVTASREAVPLALSGTSLTVIDRTTIEALALPLIKDYLTLSPSVSVSQSGPLGSQTQVRIRGAESNHTLTLIDGIAVNDPAASSEFKFETLLADGVERVEVLRGPQSALWGSEAIGGVVNILTRDVPRSGHQLYGEAEAGSFDTFRGGIGGGIGGERGGVAAQVSYLNARGYDLSSSGGDRDGYENFTAHLKGVARPSAATEFTLVARYAAATSKYDDFDYGAGVPLDAPLSTRARLAAVRGTGSLKLLDDRWTQQVALTYSDTANRNLDAGRFQNESDGSRFKLAYQSSLTAETGEAKHRLTFAAEHERQSFVSIAADRADFSNQRQSRLQTSVIGEYRIDVGDWLGGGVAVRHDWNNRFKDSTTVRITGAARFGGGFGGHASYGQGVADPTFYDLFGFYPGFFIGNPNLKPERSRGWDAGLGWSQGSSKIDVTYYRATLDDEIVSTFDSSTFLSGTANASGRSKRRGVEVSAETVPLEGLRLAATYAWLDADEQRVAGGLAVREVRRPRHSGSVTAAWTSTAFDLAASAAITGDRRDTDFARFVPVTLKAYTLLTLSGAWHVSPQIDLTGRIENALDRHYQDVFAYRTPGLTGHVGVRFRL